MEIKGAAMLKRFFICYLFIYIYICFIYDRHLLTAARRLEVPLGRFVWLGSDGWGAKIHPVRGNEDIAEGAITLLPKRFPVEGKHGKIRVFIID